jgi:tetratricopeptide (TPR) repeat protein
MVHAHLAAAKLRKGDLKAANNSFVEALKTAPDLSVTLGFIAKEYGKEKSRELAGLLDLAVIEVPGESAMFALMAETLVDRLGDIKQGLDAWRNAIALEPGRSEYYSGMGLAYYKDKKWADALRLFSLAAKADPSDATAHYNLACALALLGREEESIASLQEALSLDPKLATNAKSDRDFDAIASSRAFRDLVTSMESEIQPALGESVMPAH